MKTAEQSCSEPLESRVLGFIENHNLLDDEHCLLVAVSGGQDSVCLLHILEKLKTRLNVSLHIAHLNHHLRGADSEADAQYVEQLARKMGIPATIERRDVKTYQAEQRLSPEEAAREVRYTFLAEVALSLGTDRVAVAHTESDHIETILMHLIRGSGTRGLRGLQPTSSWRSSDRSLTIIRPLLAVSRDETAAYCQSRRLMPRVDASNLSLSPLRNRIRLELLPLLQNYNPGITEALQRTSRLASETAAFLDAECSRLWDGIAQEREGAFVISKTEFLKLPMALRRHLLRLTIERILGSLKDIEARHIEAIMEAMNKSAGRRINLPEGLTFAVDYDHFFLGLSPEVPCPFPPLECEIVLKIPGETRFPGWCVKASLVSREDVIKTEKDFIANLDFAKTGDKMTVRRRQPGDWFQPLSLGQPKKLGRFMIDARIAQSWRERIPIVTSPQQVVWVAGWRIDDRVKISESTRRVLRLEFQRTDDN